MPRCSRQSERSERSEDGQATLLIVGFAVVLLMVVALVVDATAGYLHRQGLDTLADGAALQGADLGATGVEVYDGGVPPETLALTAAQARTAVGIYLRQVGAFGRYPGLSYTVTVDPTARQVRVELRAPLDLPLTVPGSPERAVVGATGSAQVGVDQP